jgi:hypothetical protein
MSKFEQMMDKHADERHAERRDKDAEADYLGRACDECDAQPGEPCDGTGAPDKVHASRFKTWWLRHFARSLCEEKR